MVSLVSKIMSLTEFMPSTSLSTNELNFVNQKRKINKLTREFTNNAYDPILFVMALEIK